MRVLAVDDAFLVVNAHHAQTTAQGIVPAHRIEGIIIENPAIAETRAKNN